MKTKNYDYDLVVIGGGAAGFVSSKLANGLGKKVAMIEKRKLGGDCTWFGCIPSKTLLRASQIAHQIARINDYGLRSDSVPVLNTDGVMAHVRSVVQKVYQSHLPEAFEKLGISVLFGEPRFLDRFHLQLDDKVISSRNFIIATGSRPSLPSIEGIDTIPYLTNESIFNLDKLPQSMIILGGGAIGIELGSALNRLGVEITIVEMQERILATEDKELAYILTQLLQEEGIKIITKAKTLWFSKKGTGTVLDIESEAAKLIQLSADSVLIATGRKANTKGLSLERAHVETGPQGVRVGPHLQTTAPNIYACGDGVGPYLFSHMAEYQAIIATRNALLPFPFKGQVDYRMAAWGIFTDPELAHAGMTEEEARSLYGEKITVYRHRFQNSDRAKTDGAEIGMSKFICDPKGRLLGAHVLGKRASEIIHEAQLLKALNLPFRKIQSVIHVYPSYSDVIKQPAKQAFIESLRKNSFISLLQKCIMKR